MDPTPAQPAQPPASLPRRPRPDQPPEPRPDQPPEEVLRRLELTVMRRLDGLLLGDYRGLVPGHGTETGETRLYVPGDDVRRIDWNVTSRMQVPHLRETIAERELETWLLLDLSPSLHFGTADCTKRDLALAAAAAVTFLTGKAGNRLGAVLLTGSGLVTLPAATGRAHLRAVLHRAITSPLEDGGGPTDLVRGMRQLVAPGRRRGLAVVISDFLTPPRAQRPGAEGDKSGKTASFDLSPASLANPARTTVSDPRFHSAWEQPLRLLASRHETLAIEVIDPRELELPDVGVLVVTDPETGRQREVQTASAGLRESYAQAAASQRAHIAASLRSAGADHLVLRTDRDWLLDLVRFVAMRRHRIDHLRRAAPAAGRG